MPKLAIYIPKSEMRVIEHWRKQVNFSQVFMAALNEEIRRRSRRVSSSEDRIAAAADHYRRQLLAGDSALVDVGFELGCERVLNCELSSAEIRALTGLTGDLSDPQHLEKVEQSLGKEVAKIDHFARDHQVDEEFQPNWRVAIYNGYLDGVKAAWKQVCEQL